MSNQKDSTSEQKCQLLGYQPDSQTLPENRWCVTHGQPIGKCSFSEAAAEDQNSNNAANTPPANEMRLSEPPRSADGQSCVSFTPAPWTRSGTLVSDHIEIDLRLDVEGDNWIAVKGDSDAVVEANAALVIAAPKLYDAALTALVYVQSLELGDRGKAVRQELINAISLGAN